MTSEQLQALSWDNILVFLMVVAAIGSLYMVVGNMILMYRKLKRPKERQEEDLSSHQKECQLKFDDNSRDLIRHDREIRELKETQRVQCRALHELLEHELHNGNKEAMEEASRALFDHMNK